MVADRKRRGGLCGSEWKWDGVAAPGLGTSRTEAARHKDKLHLKYHHRLTLFTHEASEMVMSIDKWLRATSFVGMLERPHPLLGPQEIHSSSYKTAMFSQVPLAGFSRSLLPTQSLNSPTLQHSNTLIKNIPELNYNHSMLCICAKALGATLCLGWLSRINLWLALILMS